jgi:hypothetical protein
MVNILRPAVTQWSSLTPIHMVNKREDFIYNKISTLLLYSSLVGFAKSNVFYDKKERSGHPSDHCKWSTSVKILSTTKLLHSYFYYFIVAFC